MNDGKEVLGAVLVVLIIILFFFAGIAVGAKWGQDDIANDWCVSLGYDVGEYDDGAENIVCKYIETLEIEKGA